MKRTLILVFAAGLGGSLLAAPADAARGGRGEGRGICAEDVQKLCKDVKPGEGRIAACLKEHEKELSKACSERRAVMKERGARRGGKGGMAGAFKGRKAGWQKGYRAGFRDGFRGCMAEGPRGGKGMKARAGRGGRTNVCAADAEKLCKDVKPGEGRVRDCLQKNMKKLSDDCKSRQEKVKERLERRDKTAEKKG
ncbi:MAG TPA: cysteine rich repeat-containing protein [Elusimicrobiales bacterium]|nr:cysteine rich repeat-containing protein [Elusimicrobiales bacterium]